MGKSVARNSPGNPFEYSGWCEAFRCEASELVADAPISYNSSTHACSDDTLLGNPSSSIFTVSVVNVRMRYGLAYAGAIPNTSQSPFGRHRLQLPVGGMTLTQ